MPDPQRPSDRSASQRQADHAGLARLSDTLVPALVQKLNGSGLGELEVREGDWRIRLRRPTGTGSAPVRRERQRPSVHAPAAHGSARPSPADAAPRDPNKAAATSPTVGVFRAIATTGTRVRQGDRIAVVDLLGIPQDVAAPIDGILVELLVESGEAVEYGEEVAIVAESGSPERSTGDGSDDGTGGEV